MPSEPTDFVDGLVTMVANRDPASLEGVAVHVYRANRDMADRYFFDADGELLIIPQQGRLDLATEMGRIEIAPGEIALIPRGVRFRVGCCPTARRAAMSPRITAPCSACPSSARSAPTASPIRATS